jgi:hypothetical protein
MKDYLEIEKRKWPFPFISGLTIANDADGLSFDFFQDFMQFVNTTGETPLGEGLGLELSSSFFLFSNQERACSIYSSTDLNSEENEYAPKIDEYISAGWIDALHGIGDFDEGGFSREHALKSQRYLARHKGRLEIFTNHGTSLNVQNVGMDAPYHQGDNLDSDSYHVDILKQIGIKFVWTDSMVVSNHLSLSKSTSLIHHTKQQIRKMMGRSANYTFGKNQDLATISLRDKSIFQGFRRYAGTKIAAPNLGTFQEQLGSINWSDFYKRQMGIILYQHFGILSFDKVNPWVSSRTDKVIELRKTLLEPFQFLRGQNSLNLLWVAKCNKYLRYRRAHNLVNVQYIGNGQYEITMKNNDSCELDASWLEGLTFYAEHGRIQSLFFGEIPIRFDEVGADESGRNCVMVPFRKSRYVL